MNKQTKNTSDEIEQLKNNIPAVQTCDFCEEVGTDLMYDEFLDAFVCCKCDVKREIGGM